MAESKAEETTVIELGLEDAACIWRKDGSFHVAVPVRDEEGTIPAYAPEFWATAVALLFGKKEKRERLAEMLLREVERIEAEDSREGSMG